MISLPKKALSDSVKKEQAEALRFGQELHNNVHHGDLKKTKAEFLDSKFANHWEFVSQHLEPIRANDDRFVEYPAIVPWYKVDKNDEYWPAYEVLLKQKGWANAIGEIRSTTLALMDRIPDPNNADARDSHGMVVGRVQSGKTAHFTGVIARAADKGYNFILVLSGMYNNLRNQTQCRMDRELTGMLQEGHCVPLPSRNWISLTDSDGDFDNTKSPACLIEPTSPIIAIVKKNPTPLKKLRTWLKSNSSAVKELKLLLIDDESDYASVNTSNKEMPDAEDTLEDYENQDLSLEDLEEEENCTTINAYVRSIRNMFDLRAYIGYTATPYANVFIDPEEDGAEFNFEDGGGTENLGLTLYPRQFITALEKPPGYLGIEDYFPSKPRKDQISHTVIIKDETEDLQDRFVEIRDSKSMEIPESLYLAIIDYCLAGAARAATTDNWDDVHHSMMIHISSKAPLNLPLARLVKQTISTWANSWFDDDDPVINKLRKDMEKRWDDGFKSDVKKHLEGKITLNSLIDDYMSDFLDEIEFSILNDKESQASEIAEEEGFDIALDFEERGEKGWKVIVIGGDLLSRGLTIEGLCTSYFVREAKNYDTLIQMGRFFGIRKYAPFVRIHTTSKLVGWFTWLGSVEEDLRDEINHYASTGQSPLDFAVRVLRHDVEGGMLPTDRSKMRRVKKVNRGLQKTATQTRFLPLESVSKLKTNIRLAQTLLQGAEKMSSGRAIEGHWLWENVDVKLLDDFFAGSTFDSKAWNKEGVRGYISRILESKNLLSEWSVVLVNNPQATKKVTPFKKLKTIEIGLPTRGRPTDTSNQIAELITAEHTAIDLWGSSGSSHEKNDFQATNANGNKAFSRRLMWEKREENQPCLLLYVIDSQAEANVKGHSDLFNDKSGKPNVLGIAVILPDMELTDEEKDQIRSYYRLKDMAGSNKGN